jgi:hypothetical protein
MKKLDIYIAGVLLLLVSIYLKSPIVAMGSVLLWGVAVAETVMTRANRDKEILGLLERMAKIEKEHKVLSMDVTNVAERAKTILGETF